MYVHTTRVLAVLTITALLVACASDTTVFDPADADGFTGTVQGTVTNRAGSGLSGVLIVAQPGGQTTVSGSGGLFTLSNLPPGSYRLFATMPDFRDTLSDTVRVGLKQSLLLDRAMRLTYRYGWVRGTVRVPGRSFDPFDAGLQIENQNASARTYPDGRFLLTRVEPGMVRLYAAMRDIGYGALLCTVAPEETASVDIAIDRRGGEVTGTVRDPMGLPVAGATVSALGSAIADTTDASGSFRVTQVPSEGDVCLQVSSASLSTSFAGISVSENGTLDLRQITLQPPILYSGITITPTFVYADAGDTGVTISVPVTTVDSTTYLASFDWDTDNDGTWDGTTPTARMDYTPTTTGTDTVWMRCTAYLPGDTVFSPRVPITIVTRQANRAPRFTFDTAMAPPSATPGQLYVAIVRTVDDDGDSVRLVLPDSLGGRLSVPNDSAVHFTAQTGDTGTVRIRVTAVDNHGGAIEIAWNIRINTTPANRAPRFTHDSLAMTSVARQATQYVDTVHALDDDGDTVPYLRIDTIPRGVTLQDSIIRWTPDSLTAGPVMLRVVIEDNRGGRDTLSWTVSVSPASQAPQMTTPFTNVMGRELDTVTLFITATGAAPLTYEWWFRGLSVPSQTDSTLFFPTLSPVDTGPYLCKVTNAYGTAWSDTIHLGIGLPMAPWVPSGIDTVVIDANMGRIRARQFAFPMGDPASPSWQPIHPVSFTSDFWMDTAEVTQAEFLSLMGRNPSTFADSLFYPVHRLTWYDAILYCNARTKSDGRLAPSDTAYAYDGIVTGSLGRCSLLVNLRWDTTANGYRLPTEAEWEYACRGGNLGPYSWGSDSTPAGVSQFAWIQSATPTVTGRLQANPYHLHDMAGNASEWVWDWYAEYLSAPQKNPIGPLGPLSERCVRGGSWTSSPATIKSGARHWAPPDLSGSVDQTIGVRCVRNAP